MNQVLTVTALWYNHPNSYRRGKYFYMYSDNDWTTYKYRFLGYCVNQYAFRIATLRRSQFAAQKPKDKGE